MLIKNTRYKWLVTTTSLKKKIENKIPDHGKHITTHKFNNLMVENSTARLTQANLVSRFDFDSKLISFNRKIT